MKSLKLLLFMLFIFSCKKKNSGVQITTDMLTKSTDTIIVHENGEKKRIIFDVKIESINNSINGKVEYSYLQDGGDFTYDKFGNKSKTVYKDEYMLDEFRIYVSDDTLFVGEILNATVWTNKKNYSIEIYEPIKEKLNSDQTINSYKLAHPCNEQGLFSFAGIIKYDSTKAFPFEYKFLVLEKN